MYVVFNRVILDHDYFYANVYIHICIYVCRFLTGLLEIMMFYVNAYVMYVCMSLFDMVAKDHVCGGMITYASE